MSSEPLAMAIAEEWAAQEKDIEQVGIQGGGTVCSVL